MGQPAQAARDLRVPRRVRDRAGEGQEGPVRGGVQPLQAGPVGRGHPARRGRRRAGQVEHPAARPHRLGQDPAGPDAGPAAQRPVRDRRRHRAHRGGLRGRGCREHPAQADPGGRVRREEGRDRDHLHRRDRQDRPQEREPLHHPGRLGGGRAAGAAEDPRGHHRLGAAAGRPEAPAPGVHPDRHDQRPVHLRWLLLRAGEDHRVAGRQERDGLRRGAPGQERPGLGRRLRRRDAGGPAQVRDDPGVRRAGCRSSPACTTWTATR